MEQPLEATGLVGVLEQATEALRGLAQDFPTWSLSESDVAAGIRCAQRLGRLSQALTAVLAREADSRALGAEDGLSRTDWLKAQAGQLEGGYAAAVALVGAAMREERWARLAELVCTGEASVPAAAAVLRFHQDVARLADPQQLHDIVESLVEALPHLGMKELNRLVSLARAALKPPKDLEDEAERGRLGRMFSKVGRVAGLAEYRLRVDAEGEALIDAAIDPLAKPRPDVDFPGEERRDPRLPATRRADALLEIFGRAMANPEGSPRTPRTKVVVTMTLEALLDQLRGAGLADNDAVLSPGTARRMACEAEIIPMVLGAPSEVLDVGRAHRFFTPAQRVALTRRDQGCTFPGCTIPPQWCNAHHVTHWVHGGSTDLLNGALLCERHHTVVHTRDLTATVTTTGVTWHL